MLGGVPAPPHRYPSCLRKAESYARDRGARAGNLPISAARPRPSWAPWSAILLDSRGAQSGKAMRLERAFPGAKFLFGQLPAAKRLFERNAAAAHGGDDSGFATHHPTSGVRRREV